MGKLTNDTVTGNRSQAEQIVIDLLRFHFRKLKILPNDKTAIGRELDIYLPDYKIAIEIDGVFHQRPVYGEESFERTQRNDLKKSEKCQEAGIKLYRITLPEDSRTYYKFLKEEVSNNLVTSIKTWITS